MHLPERGSYTLATIFGLRSIMTAMSSRRYRHAQRPHSIVTNRSKQRKRRQQQRGRMIEAVGGEAAAEDRGALGGG